MSDNAPADRATQAWACPRARSTARSLDCAKARSNIGRSGQVYDQPGQWHLSVLVNAGGAKCPLTTATACIKQHLDDHGRHRTEVDETKQSREQAAERRAGVETPKRQRQVQAIQESKTAAQESQMDTVRLMTWWKRHQMVSDRRGRSRPRMWKCPRRKRKMMARCQHPKLTELWWWRLVTMVRCLELRLEVEVTVV